jgi:hypothetical protein
MSYPVAYPVAMTILSRHTCKSPHLAATVATTVSLFWSTS